MYAQPSGGLEDTPRGEEAQALLRNCVHCGFCLPACPTYRITGNELDSPRGRIYLIKQVLEGGNPTAKTRLHLDRCLACRSCETTCPSGVEYGRLLDIGRRVVAERAPRPASEQATRWALRRALLAKPLFGAAVALGRSFRPLLPATLARKVPGGASAAQWPAGVHPRKMLLQEGCVQPALAPGIDAAMARVLDRISVTLVRAEGGCCCGALAHHLDASGEAREQARRNIDVWWPHVERGAEAIVVTASGCGVTVKDYGHFLRDDPAYARKAARIAALAKDPVEVIAAEWPKIAPQVAMDRGAQKVAFHPPCTLQHGMRLKGRVEEILGAVGFDLVAVRDAHLCCGSAGTYSLLQPDFAALLRQRKIDALTAGHPEVIATANIGCLVHLAEVASQPVRHWIELLDDRTAGGAAQPPGRE